MGKRTHADVANYPFELLEFISAVVNRGKGVLDEIGESFWYDLSFIMGKVGKSRFWKVKLVRTKEELNALLTFSQCGGTPPCTQETKYTVVTYQEDVFRPACQWLASLDLPNASVLLLERSTGRREEYSPEKEKQEKRKNSVLPKNTGMDFSIAGNEALSRQMREIAALCQQ